MSETTTHDGTETVPATGPTPSTPTPSSPPPEPAPAPTPPASSAATWEDLATQVGLAPDQVLEKLNHARKWEQRAKENGARAALAEQKATRLTVAAEIGVPADLLAGDTEEAMREHAEKLKAFRGSSVTPAPTTPKPDPSQGTRGGGTSLGREAGLEAARKRFPEKYQTT